MSVFDVLDRENGLVEFDRKALNLSHVLRAFDALNHIFKVRQLDPVFNVLQELEKVFFLLHLVNIQTRVILDHAAHHIFILSVDALATGHRGHKHFYV